MKFFENGKQFLTRALLIFVIFSVGFAFGKHSEKMRSGKNSGINQASEHEMTGETRVRLYYLHAMFRCITCNSIQEKAVKLTESEFSSDLAAKRLEWVEVNFQEDRAIAEKFDVFASGIVVAVVRADKVVSFERLDEVWNLLENDEKFNAYLRVAIKNALEKI